MTKPLQWDPDAEARLKKAPFFVRKFARQKVEKVARERGIDRITLALVEDIKKQSMGE